MMVTSCKLGGGLEGSSVVAAFAAVVKTMGLISRPTAVCIKFTDSKVSRLPTTHPFCDKTWEPCLQVAFVAGVAALGTRR